MPGRGSYGPGGRWIHDRAHRIMEESEGTPKSMAYAIATQQAHKVGKSPKKFRTPAGVQAAMSKMPGPVKEYKKTAAPISAGTVLRRARRIPIKPTIQEGISVIEPAVVARTSRKKRSSRGITKTALFKEAVSEYAKAKRRERRRANKKAKVKAQMISEGVPTRPKPTPTPPPKPSFAPTLRGRGGRPTKILSTAAEPAVSKVKQTAERGWRVRPLHTAPKDTAKQVSKLRRYGLPAGAALGALAIGGMLHRSHKKDKADIEKFFKGGNEKQAMIKAATVRGLFDELEKISQAPSPPTPPAPGMGAASPASVGTPGTQGGNAAASPPPLTSPVTSPVGGGVAAAGTPSAKMGT
jgi:hypothetical protein